VSVVIFLGGVRFAHRAEAKGRHRQTDPNFSCRCFYRKDPGMTISFPFLPRFRFNYLRV
jgi:hypothetical protein